MGGEREREERRRTGLWDKIRKHICFHIDQCIQYIKGALDQSLAVLISRKCDGIHWCARKIRLEGCCHDLVLTFLQITSRWIVI